jgi:hypothetical protein
LPRNSGASTSRNPKGLSRPVAGKLLLMYIYDNISLNYCQNKKCLTTVVEKIKTHILRSINFSRKSCRLQDHVEKCVTARQTTYGNIIRCMRFACWITKATNTSYNTASAPQKWLRKRVSILRLNVHFPSCLLRILDEKSQQGRWRSVKNGAFKGYSTHFQKIYISFIHRFSNAPYRI